MKITYDEWTEVLHAWHLACDEVEQLREAARAYRTVLNGADTHGQLSEDFADALEHVEARYAALIEADLDDTDEEEDGS